MAVQPIQSGDIVQIIIGTRLFGQQCLNVLYFKSSGSQALISYIAAVENLIQRVISDEITGIVEPMRAATAPELAFEFVQGQRVYTNRSMPLRIALNTNGTAALGACKTANVAAVITKQGETPGRGRSGSFHLAGLGTNGIVEGQLSGDQEAAMENLNIALRLDHDSAVAEVEWQPGMFNPTLGAPANWNPVVNTRIENTARVMRRRTVGLGI